jgi:hypothetical protein
MCSTPFVIFAECMSLDGDDDILSDVFLDALSDSFDVENDFAP